MTQKANRGRRRGPVKNAATPVTADRYQKFLPEWMRGNGGTPPPRPQRAKRARQPRPVGGYTPGKFALGGNTLDSAR